MANDDSQNLSKLVAFVQGALTADAALRDKYNVGHKFRFIPERIQSLLKGFEAKVLIINKANASAEIIHEEESIVYVYLYNAQGLVLRNWQNMLTPKVFYEYSVNRPIYDDKTNIEKLLRSKSNRMQHAYLTIAIKPVDIISLRDGEAVRRDALGNPLIRVKEGSLRFQKLIAFTHNELDFIVNEVGELVKK